MEHGYDFQIETEKNLEVVSQEQSTNFYVQAEVIIFHWISNELLKESERDKAIFICDSISEASQPTRPGLGSFLRTGVDEAWRVVAIRGHVAYRWRWHPHQAVRLPPLSSSQHWQSPEDRRGSGLRAGDMGGRRGGRRRKKRKLCRREWLCLRKSANTCIQKPLVRPLFLTLFQSGGLRSQTTQRDTHQEEQVHAFTHKPCEVKNQNQGQLWALWFLKISCRETSPVQVSGNRLRRARWLANPAQSWDVSPVLRLPPGPVSLPLLQHTFLISREQGFGLRDAAGGRPGHWGTSAAAPHPAVMSLNVSRHR